MRPNHQRPNLWMAAQVDGRRRRALPCPQQKRDRGFRWRIAPHCFHNRIAHGGEAIFFHQPVQALRPMTGGSAAREGQIEQSAHFGNGLFEPARGDRLRDFVFEAKHGVAMSGVKNLLPAIKAARMRSEFGGAIENAHVGVGSSDGQSAA